MPIGSYSRERKGVGDSIGNQDAANRFADKLKELKVRPSHFNIENLMIPSRLLIIRDEITDKLGRYGLATETEEIRALRDKDAKIAEEIRALRDKAPNVIQNSPVIPE